MTCFQKMFESAWRYGVWALLVLVPNSLFAAAMLPRPGLLSDSAAEQLYLVRTAQSNQPQATTFIRVESRELPEGQWKKRTELAGRALTLTTWSGEYVLLMDSGDWRYGKALGIALPQQRDILLLHGHGSQLFAIGGPVHEAASLESASAPIIESAHPQAPANDATQSATHPAEAADVPQTEPATASSATTQSLSIEGFSKSEAVLFRLDKSTWRPVCGVPRELAEELSPLNASATLVDGNLVVARLVSSETVAIWSLSSDHQWHKQAVVSPPFSVRAMRLMNTGGSSTLWVSADSGLGGLYFASDHFASFHALKMDTDLTGVTRRSVTVAAERIRLFFVKDDQLFEQQFSETGEAIGSAASITLPSAPNQKMLNFIQVAMMFALLFLFIGSMRKKPNGKSPVGVNLAQIAPLRQRAAAGLIDAIPLLAGYMIYLNQVDDPIGHMMDSASYPVWIGLAVYFLHITLSEMIGGQSIGKMIFQLRVVSIDGSKARPLAILIRNAILMIELILTFPLVLVFYSPLRQRIGDMTARTIVIKTTLSATNDSSGSADGHSSDRDRS